MAVLTCGSFAFDNIMVFEDRFGNHILPDKVHQLNVAFHVPSLRREFGGCAGNIAYGLTLLEDTALPMATVGNDFKPYADRMDAHGIPRRYLLTLDDSYTAQAFIITDRDGNQITAFHPGAMDHSHTNNLLTLDPPTENPITLGIVSPDGRAGMIGNAEYLAERDVPFIFDPGQGLPLFQAENLITFLDQATWVIVNGYEWAMLSERTGLGIAQVLARVRALIITRGEEGSEIHTPGASIGIPALPVPEALDPTGCGDAYRAGILHGLLGGMDWETTGRIATLMGAFNVRHVGTQHYRSSPTELADRFKAAFGYDL